MHDLSNRGTHALREARTQLGGDLRRDRVHDLRGNVGADLGQRRIIPDGFHQIGAEFVGIHHLVGADRRLNLLEHLGLTEVVGGQDRKVRRTALFDLLLGVFLEPLSDLAGLSAQVFPGPVLDCAVGERRLDDRGEVDGGEFGDVLAEVAEVQLGQVDAHARLRA